VRSGQQRWKESAVDDLKAREKKAAAEVFCREHLGECCEELLEYRKTGLLRDGKVRELAQLMAKDGDDSLEMAEWAIQVEAMRFCAESAKGAKAFA
jgi:hypothetical protein